MFRLMAILYEKFTTQKNLLADLLKEIQENNDKIAEANKYLAKINKTQAQAARQGEEARVSIPADVIIFFKQRNINMPTEFFGNNAEISTYDNSNFNKRMAFLDEKGGISILFSYVAQGRLKGGESASSNVMLGDLSNRDLLELGTLKELYEQTDMRMRNLTMFALISHQDTTTRMGTLIMTRPLLRNRPMINFPVRRMLYRANMTMCYSPTGIIVPK
jgi:hypothetical protein